MRGTISEGSPSCAGVTTSSPPFERDSDAVIRVDIGMSFRSPSVDCPSAQPDMERARVFGLIGGTAAAPRIAYLKRGRFVDAAVLKNFGGIDTSKVYRFAGTCERHRCVHYDGAHCGLAEQIVAFLPAVVDRPPPCEIRSTCLWHAEQGDDVCRRCPQVVTMVPPARERLRVVALAAMQRSSHPD